jgi:hypothetical protein
MPVLPLPADLAGGHGGRSGRTLAAPPLPDTLYGELRAALDVLEVPAAHDLGLSGAGVRVGILDGHFFPGHPAVSAHPPLASRDFVDGDGVVEPGPADSPLAAAHGTALWSLVVGDRPGLLRGAAPGAGVLLARVRGTGALAAADEDRWVAGLEWLESQGARVVLSGVGFRSLADVQYSIGELDGDRTPATLAADEAARRGTLVVVPVGNGGPGRETLVAPADGDSVLAVGALDSLGFVASMSAQGPTGDGRPKPELLAPGDPVPAASVALDNLVGPVSGTEYAAALVAGVAALVVEALPQLGPMELAQALRASASPGASPFAGAPRAASAILFPGGIEPLPVQGVDGQGRVTTLAPLFQWDAPLLNPLGLPVSFHLQLSQDSLFRTVALEDAVVGTFARRLPTPLPPRSRLFWRVEARSRQGIGWASAAQGPLAVPSWVALQVLNDPGGTEVGEPTPEFRWTALPLPPPGGPLVFDLEVVSDRGGDLVQRHTGLAEPRLRVPEPLPFNTPLRWRVIARATAGAADTVLSSGPFVVTSGAKPPVTILYQNFPNPFPHSEVGGGRTRFWFDLATTSEVELAIFNLRGRLVRRLIPRPGCGPVELTPGLYGREESALDDPCQSYSWGGRDDQGRTVERGVYLLRLKAGGVIEVRRLVFWP